MTAINSAKTRNGRIVTIDARSAPRIVHFGEDFLLEKLPVGTRVIYPPDPLPALPDVDAAIADALVYPHDSAPLADGLEPGMKVTIAIDDISLPLPPMRNPDVRERALKILLPMLAQAGVEDVLIGGALGPESAANRGRVGRIHADLAAGGQPT